jgi:hypothetical protein
VCALASGKPIVTPQYWDNYITALSTKQPCPDCKDYMPPLAETTLNMNEVSFGVNENRKKLFTGKHFVFSSSHQYNSYSCMVTAAGNVVASSFIKRTQENHLYICKYMSKVKHNSLVYGKIDTWCYDRP